MTIEEGLLDGLAKRRDTVVAGGGDAKMKARHEKGLLSARERLDALFQDGTFQEMGAHVRHSAHQFGMDGKELPADGVVVGTGCVDGRVVAAFSQDFTVAAGTLGKMHATKMVQAMRYALKTGKNMTTDKDQPVVYPPRRCSNPTISSPASSGSTTAEVAAWSSNIAAEAIRFYSRRQARRSRAQARR